MEVKHSENQCPNPKCDATVNDGIDWGNAEICDGFTKQTATCNKCGAEFTEYYTLVYQGTEYDPLDYDNPYSLYMDGDCSKRQYDICVGITKEITKILRALVVMRKSGFSKTDDKILFNIACIRMLRLARIGVGDPDTDEKIAGVYQTMLVSGAHMGQAKSEIESKEFYKELHRS